jgi:hypothetical protein
MQKPLLGQTTENAIAIIPRPNRAEIDRMKQQSKEWILAGIALALAVIAIGCDPNRGYDRVRTTTKFVELKCHVVGTSQGVSIDQPIHIDQNGTIDLPKGLEPLPGEHLDVECVERGVIPRSDYAV